METQRAGAFTFTHLSSDEGVTDVLHFRLVYPCASSNPTRTISIPNSTLPLSSGRLSGRYRRPCPRLCSHLCGRAILRPRCNRCRSSRPEERDDEEERSQNDCGRSTRQADVCRE